MIYEFGQDVKNIDTDDKQEDGWPLFIDKFVMFLKNKQKLNKLNV